MAHRSLPVRQLPSGRWQARPAGVDPATFDSYDEAEGWCLEQLVARSRGTAAPPGTSRLTFRAYAEEWRAAQPWSPGTRERVHTNLHKHLYPRIGDVAITRLRPTQLQALVTGLADGLAPSTVGTVVQHLRQVLNGAVADRIIAESPAARLRLPRPDDEPIVVPTRDQVHTITDRIDPRYRALVVVGAGLGLRQGEAFALTRSSVDFLRRQVHVRAQIVRPANGAPRIEDTTKTGRARTVPLPDVVADELARHIERHDSGHPAGLVFTSAQAMTLRADHWNVRYWHPAREAAGLDAGFHAMRHFAATSLLRSGVSVAAVARILGHSPATCLAYYSHWIADDAELIRGVLDNTLRNDVNEPVSTEVKWHGSGTPGVK